MKKIKISLFEQASWTNYLGQSAFTGAPLGAVAGAAGGYKYGALKAKEDLYEYIKKNNLNPENPQDAARIAQYEARLIKKYTLRGIGIGALTGLLLGAGAGMAVRKISRDSGAEFSQGIRQDMKQSASNLGQSIKSKIPFVKK